MIRGYDKRELYGDMITLEKLEKIKQEIDSLPFEQSKNMSITITATLRAGEKSGPLYPYSNLWYADRDNQNETMSEWVERISKRPEKIGFIFAHVVRKRQKNYVIVDPVKFECL